MKTNKEIYEIRKLIFLRYVDALKKTSGIKNVKGYVSRFTIECQECDRSDPIVIAFEFHGRRVLLKKRFYHQEFYANGEVKNKLVRSTVKKLQIKKTDLEIARASEKYRGLVAWY